MVRGVTYAVKEERNSVYGEDECARDVRKGVHQERGSRRHSWERICEKGRKERISEKKGRKELR